MILLYIDPGTGSMLFAVLIGIAGAVLYSIRMMWIKLRFKISGGKVDIKSAIGKGTIITLHIPEKYKITSDINN